MLVAKLAMGALAQGDVVPRADQERVEPDDPQRDGSSGSSADPGSATAAGLVGFAIGTETRGSIISPSAVNGIAGSPSDVRARQSYGAMGLSWTMTKSVPIAGSVEDCALVFHAIHGPDGHDDTVVDAPFT